MNLVKKYIRLERLVLVFIVTALIIMSNQAAYAAISLAPPVEYFLGENYFPQNMSSADFNNDGNMDYVVSGHKNNVSLFSVMLGNGNGGFVQTDYFPGFTHIEITVYDMNKDGKQDVIINDFNNNIIQIHYGDGTGLFLAYDTFYGVNRPKEMFGNDFNKDGVPDMLIGSESGLHILIGRIEGLKWVISSVTDYLTGIRIEHPAVADFNNDGYDDIAADSAYDGGIYIITNNHDGTFTPGTAYCSDVYVNSSIACSDYDKDGKNDIVIMDRYSELRILKGLGDGSLTDSGIKYVLNQCMYEPFAADINEDGYDDIVGTVNNDSIAVIEGNGDGTFKTIATYFAKSSSYPRSVVCADYDNDGALDIAAVEEFNKSAVFFRNMMMDCIKNIEFSSVEHRIGTAKDIQITVSMQGVSDGSEIKASLISLDGIDLSPAINDIQTVANNSAVLTLHVPDNLALGTYKIKIEIAGKAKTYESNYLIYDYGTIVWNTVNEKISENASECSISFSRINGGKGELNIDFSLGGTAILGKDYEKSEFSDGILLADGYDNKTVTLKFKLLNDDIFEGDETITMTLSPAPSSTVIPKGLPATATITIKDDETTPLVKIITPSAISGVASGTAKDSAALGLPEQVELKTEDGNFKADVTWDVNASSYDPSSKLSQSFTVDGNVTLPSFVTNPSNLDLNASIEVNVNEKIPGKFSVSAVYSIGGSTTGSGIYSEGASVTVKADPDSGYKFVNWMENGVVVSTDASYTFTIGSENRTLTAFFDEITPKYTVVFIIDDGNNQPIVSVKEVLKGEKVGSLPAAPVRDGYDFIGWNTLPDGSGYAFTENTEVYSGVTVYAKWNKHDSSNGGSGSNVPFIKTNKISTATDAKTKTTVSTVLADSDIDANGKATALLTENDISSAVNSAVKEAEKQNEPASAKIEIKTDATKSSKSVETIIPKTAFNLISESKINSLTVSSPIGSITFDSDSLDTISKESTGDIRITVAKIDSSALSDEAKQVVGNRAVYEFGVVSGANNIHEFNGNVTVSVPYALRAGEDANSIVIYYINSEGKPEIITNSRYDALTGMITFTTNHFSMYAVGCNKVNFADVSETAWYFEAINFISARNITSGTEYEKFSPDSKLTRGQFLVMVMRAYDILPDENSDYNFSDAGNTYYTGYVAAARRLGITNGSGNNVFEPDKEITRQEMAVLLYNTLKEIEKLPRETDNQLTSFNDSNLVADWAKDAMILFVGTGTINGSDNMLNPTATANRAEMAQLLYNLLTK